MRVEDTPDGFVGKESVVKVDASAAGVGEVLVTVESQGRAVPVVLKEVGGRGVYEAAFTPREAGQHGIKVAALFCVFLSHLPSFRWIVRENRHSLGILIW